MYTFYVFKNGFTLVFGGSLCVLRGGWFVIKYWCVMKYIIVYYLLPGSIAMVDMVQRERKH